jgi:hypothetical protein
MTLAEVEFSGRLPIDIPAVEQVDWFDRFWMAYPRKVGKPAARRAFQTAMKKSPLVEIGDGLRRWQAYWTWRNAPQFIPHPSTWLNQERWNDDPPPVIGQDQGVLLLDRIIAGAR